MPFVVEKKHGVMHDARVARMKLDRRHEPVLARRNRDHEILQDVRAIRAHRKRLRHFHDEIGLTEPPAVRKFRQRRQIAGISLRRARRGPRAEKREFLLAQPPLADEPLVPARRNPRGHHALARHPREQLRALGGLRVVRQRKRRGLSVTMAVRAARENQRRDVARKSRPRTFRGGRIFKKTTHGLRLRDRRFLSLEHCRNGLREEAIFHIRPPPPDRLPRIVDRPAIRHAPIGTGTTATYKIDSTDDIFHVTGIISGSATGYTTPKRLAEGGRRVPCFVRWPAGKIGGGKEGAGLTQVQDLLPTLWPVSSALALHVPAPVWVPRDTATPEHAGFAEGVALPIASATLRIGKATETKPVAENDQAAIFRRALKAGRTELEGSFQDADGKPVGATYFVTVKLAE